MQLQIFSETCSHSQSIRDILLSIAKHFQNIEIANEFWPYNFEASTISIQLGNDVI